MNKIFVASFVVAIALSATMIMAQGLSNEQISMQGRLTDADAKPLDGTYVMTFEIFDSASGGTGLWSETQTVTVDKGLFQTRLGTVEALDLNFDEPYYVEVTVNDKTLSPRYVLAASAYTLGGFGEGTVTSAMIKDKAVRRQELAKPYRMTQAMFNTGGADHMEFPSTIYNLGVTAYNCIVQANNGWTCACTPNGATVRIKCWNADGVLQKPTANSANMAILEVARD